jgi:hypothetical protein
MTEAEQTAGVTQNRGRRREKETAGSSKGTDVSREQMQRGQLDLALAP